LATNYQILSMVTSNQYTYTVISATLLLSFGVSLLGLHGFPFHDKNLTWEENETATLESEYQVGLILTNLAMGFLVDVFGGARCLIGNWILTFVLLYFLATEGHGAAYQTYFTLLVLVNALVVPSIHQIIRGHKQCERLLYTTVFFLASKHMLVRAFFNFTLSYISLPLMCYIFMLLSIGSIVMLVKLFYNQWDSYFRDIQIFDLPAFIFSYRQLVLSKHFWIYLFWNIFTGCFVYGGRFFDSLVEDGSDWFDTGVIGGLMICGAVYLMLSLELRVKFIYGCIAIATMMLLISSFFHSEFPPSSMLLVALGFCFAVPHYIAPTLMIFRLEKQRCGNCYAVTQGASQFVALFFSLTIRSIYEKLPGRALVYLAIICANTGGAIYLSVGQKLMKEKKKPTKLKAS